MENKNLKEAISYLNSNQLVAIPTETVYGLAGNAYSEDALLRIFEVKQRPKFDPLIVHTSSVDRIKNFVKEVPETAYALFEKFSPGPLTILLPKRNNIPDLVTSGLPRVAVRIPGHLLTLQLLESLDFPLAAPSANPFGYISPTSAQHVANQLGDKIPYILDGGECEVGVESTIVGFEEGHTVVYRLGGLAIEEIEKVAGKVIVYESTSSPTAPGMLKSHYAPSKPFYLGDIESLLRTHRDKATGIISFNNQYPGKYSFTLSESGSLAEASKNLFKYMRLLDESPVESIVAEFLPEEGLGRAINDRLKRAATMS